MEVDLVLLLVACFTERSDGGQSGNEGGLFPPVCTETERVDVGAGEIAAEFTYAPSTITTDSEGVWTGWYEEYHPFGSTSWHARDSAIEVSQKRYRYTGKEKDDETGLYYHGARHMAPWLGRWTACDPKLGGNRYRYCSNSPVGKFDPDGKDDIYSLYNQYTAMKQTGLIDLTPPTPTQAWTALKEGFKAGAADAAGDFLEGSAFLYDAVNGGSGTSLIGIAIRGSGAVEGYRTEARVDMGVANANSQVVGPVGYVAGYGTTTVGIAGADAAGNVAANAAVTHGPAALAAGGRAVVSGLERAEARVAGFDARVASEAAGAAEVKAAGLDDIGPPTSTPNKRGAPYETPWDMTIANSGSPLDVSALDQGQSYIWAVDEEGNFLLAPQFDEAGVERTHGSLVFSKDGTSRGVARAGGELNFRDGGWVMDQNSSFNFWRDNVPRGERMPASSLDAVDELLRSHGSDTSGVTLDYSYNAAR